jgi:hypothetical protein
VLSSRQSPSGASLSHTEQTDWNMGRGFLSNRPSHMTTHTQAQYEHLHGQTLMVPSIHTLVHDPKKIGKSPNPIKQWKGMFPSPLPVCAQNISWNVSFTSWKWQVDDVGATDWERSGRQYVTVQTPRDSYQTPTASALEGHLQPLFWTVGGQNIKSHLLVSHLNSTLEETFHTPLSWLLSQI